MSDKKSLEQTIGIITEIAEKISNPLGLIVVDIRFGQQGRRRTLDATIFRKETPISLSDCEQFSRLLEAELDAKAAKDGPLVEGTFDLQVQSPGIDRQLKTEREFRVFIGQPVEIQTKEKIGDLGVHFKGILVAYGAGKIELASAEQIRQPVKGKKVQAQETHDISFDAKLMTSVKLYADDLQKHLENKQVQQRTDETLGGLDSDQNR